jgi:tRNA (cmo5U34)-methyltransferase
MDPPPANRWGLPEHALEYLARADTIPYRTEGEGVLLECLPPRVSRVLDLGTGDGRLLALVKAAHPAAQAVAIDFSTTMLNRFRERFAADRSVELVMHNLDNPLPVTLGTFDAIVSSFAIHHLAHERKRTLFEEVFCLLTPGGVFGNLEHVASRTTTLHHQFLAALSVRPEDEDPSNKLLDVEIQLAWLHEIGFVDVDCLWKWRELAVLAAIKPVG